MVFATIQRGIKFSMVGALCTAIAYAAFVGLAPRIGYLAANLVSWTSGLVISFLLNRRWTYQIKDKTAREEQFMVFLVGTIVQLGIASLGYWVLIGKLHLNTSVAFVVNLVFTSAFMFAYMDSLTFGMATRWAESRRDR